MAKFKPKSVKELLDEQSKVRIMVPGTPGVKAEHDYKSVIINGYALRIKCGEYVDVPKSVADILSNSSAAIAKSREAFADLTAGAGLNLSEKADAPVKDA